MSCSTYAQRRTAAPASRRSGDLLEPGRQVRLEWFAHRGHVEGPQELAVDQTVEPVPGGVVLRGRRPRDDVRTQLHLRAVDRPDPDLGVPGPVRERDLE